ncbi:Ras association (RalGDS/AF6) domain containing protein [Acanthamoeba castellanii str. Neff]|uniref:Ras association (RalGDS/AF6) domain containing protein n=1 Tax=Acanthamoeba castellanii (strain ATCC 30010 / Neff) TaxID=1257118 RepID=L8GP50_ACACF|nr:Ras association (RalGDS/AF6) domain containing protein [Acanthamoeba castellanii str. Neff]ELR14959.1 Ras association (RalGDS/AF6) domain containing protein [Acanthamoeba castellanii str. Neff]
MAEAAGVARIFLKDGSYKAVRVTGSTTIREACGMFARRLQLPLLSEAYELRQITPQGERVLGQEERVWDVLQEFATHPDYDPLELQEEKVKYRLMFSFTEDMRTRLSVRVGLPPPRPGKPAPAGVSFLTPSNPHVPVSPLSMPSGQSSRSSPMLMSSPPMSPPLSPTAGGGSMTMRRPPPPVPERSGMSRRQTFASDGPPNIPAPVVPAPYSQPSQPTSHPAFQLEAPTFQQPPPQPPVQAQAQARPPGSSGRPLPQPNTARQGRPLPQPQPRGQPRTPPTAAAPPSTPAPVAVVPAPVVSPLQPTARSPAFAASPAPAPPAPEPRRTEAERDSDVDELASVIFKIEGLDQFSSVTASQVPSVPPPRLRA